MAPVLARAVRTLTDAGIASPRVDAELLAAAVLGVPRGRLVLAEADRGQRAAYERLVARRAAGVPVQHLTGTAPFRYLELAVGPGVFVPRPETELLVDAGRALLDTASPVVVDLCAGSGALGLSAASEIPGATVHLVEADPDALVYLRRNAAAVGGAVEVVEGDVTAPDLLPGLTGAVDLVLANPPYVPAGTALPADVAGVDPDRALYGGPDGLAVIRPMLGTVARLLRPGGGLAVEYDDTHGTAVPALLRADGRFTDVTPHRDLAGRPRYSTARRSGKTGTP